MNRTLASDRVRRRLADQMSMNGMEHVFLPKKSPTLKTRKWIAVNNSGCVAGFVGRIDRVIGGKTDYGEGGVSRRYSKIHEGNTTYKSGHEDTCHSNFIKHVRFGDS